MFKDVLREIGGIGLYGVISICIFFVVFTGSFIRACLHRKTHLNAMSMLPLNDAEVGPKGGISHE